MATVRTAVIPLAIDRGSAIDADDDDDCIKPFINLKTGRLDVSCGVKSAILSNAEGKRRSSQCVSSLYSALG